MIRILALITVVVMPFFAPTTQAQNDQLHVVASFSILADVVVQVAGDAVEIEMLVPVGANPHTFEPSARDVATLSDADLVFVVGIDYEGGLFSVLDEAAGDNVVQVSECVPVLPVIEDDDHAPEDDDHDAIGASGLDCEQHHTITAAAFNVDHLELASTLGIVAEGVCEDIACDPHVWTDPANVALWTLAIRDSLSARDPDHAALYAENADVYLAELATLDADIRIVLDSVPVDQRIMVTNHLSFNYFATRYGLTTVGVILPGGSTGSEPSARDVISLINTIKDSGARAIFTETTVNDSLARQIANETGVAVVQLYTGSLSAADGPAGTYVDYMRFNTEQIAAALQ